FPDEPQDEIHKYLYNRELGLNTARLPPNWFSIVSRRMPHLFQETQIDLGNHDKIFCSHWISHNEIVVGTKCNKLLILNVETNKNIAVNPSRTLLAIGAGNPVQVMIYELPSFEPVIVFSGHNDLVFSVAWLDDSSRDGTVRLWSIESKIISEMPLFPNKFVNVHQPLLTRSENGGKVRDLQFNSKTDQIMTLSTAGYVRLWDASYLNPVTKIPLIHTNENVCLSMNSKVNLFAVGSQAHISIVDPRTSSIVHEIDSVDEGVRSLNFDDHIITTGGGYGRLSFYDMRAQNYLVFNTSNDESSVTCNYKETGSGWLNAIYTLSYDESGTMLFTGGGPLQLGLKGSHATIWS
ncbi:4003_t:CDS:2, partial [Gigaspora rosea]